MEIFQTFVLALVQSITEFLPVSSSAHLILVPYFTGWDDQGIAMDIGMHVGTLFAVVVYFWPSFWNILTGFYKKGSSQHLFLCLVVGTIPALIVGFLLEKWVETTLRSPFIIAFTLIFFGVVLYWADKKSQKKKTIDGISLKDAFYVGCAQCLALIPGTSRSGITMIAARVRGMKRPDAAQFSMMLSVPVIAAAAIWHIGGLWLAHDLSVLNQSFWLGIIFSFVGGLTAVWFLMKWVKTKSFFIFAAYRILLGFYLLWFLC